MSLDYSTSFGIGVSIQSDDLDRALNLRVVGREEASEPRFDPKTGKPADPITVVKNRGKKHFTVNGVDYCEDDMEMEREHRLDAFMIGMLMKHLGVTNAHYEYEESNCKSNTALVVYFNERNAGFTPDEFGGVMAIRDDQEAISNMNAFSKQLDDVGIPHIKGFIVLNSIW